jgi:hypothetical protein
MWQLVAASHAHAYEDRLTLAIDAGYAHATQRQLPQPGGAVGVDASLGLSNAWSVRAGVTYAYHPGSQALSQLALHAELLYLVDVFELVPYAGVGLDGLASWAAHTDPRAAFGVHPVLGVDWLLSRDFALGLFARPIFVVSDWKHQPFVLEVMASAVWLFDR